MAERGELTLEEAARRLAVSKMTVLRLISAGTISAQQVCKGAPWAITEADIAALADASSRPPAPRTRDTAQKQLDFQ